MIASPQPMLCFRSVAIDPSENIIHGVESGNDKLDDSNLSLINDKLQSTVNDKVLDNSQIWKYKVNSDLGIHKEFSNVGEPLFASNGSLLLFAGNHYTGRLVNGSNLGNQ